MPKEFEYLDPILKGKTLQDLAKEFHIPPSGKSAETIPKQKGVLYFGADLHENYADWKELVKIWITDLANGESAHILSLGDINDPLFEQDSENNIVTRSLDDKEGLDMFSRNLAMRTRINDGEEVFALLSHPSDFPKIMWEYGRIRNLFGARANLVKADHEEQLRTHGFEVFKGGVDLTEYTRKRYKPEDAEKLKSFLRNQPFAVRTENGYLFIHAGPVPMLKSWTDLENLAKDKEAPTRNSGEDLRTFNSRKMKWLNETIEGRLTWGKIDEDGHRIYNHEEIKKTLLATGTKGIISGHSANAHFFFEKEGESTMYYGVGLGGVVDLEGQLIVGYTEVPGCNSPRSGQNRDGPNTRGVIGAIDLSEEFGNVYFGRAGEQPRPHPIKKVRLEPTVKHATMTPFMKCANQMREVCERGGYPYEIYTAFVAAKDELDGKLDTELLEASRHFEKTDARNIPADFQRDHTPYLKQLPERIRKALSKKIHH